MSFKDLFDEFCDTHNIEAASPLIGQMTSLTFDDDRTISFLPNQGGHTVLSAVISVSDAHLDRAELKKILQLNLALMKKQPETIMIDPDQNQLIMRRTVDLVSATLEEFTDIIHSFLGSMGYWRETLRKKTDQNPSLKTEGNWKFSYTVTLDSPAASIDVFDPDKNIIEQYLKGTNFFLEKFQQSKTYTNRRRDMYFLNNKDCASI